MATELKVRRKYREVTNGTQKSPGGTAGVKKHKTPLTRAEIAALRDARPARERVLHMLPSGKRRMEWR
jgi:hypothetical protein